MDCLFRSTRFAFDLTTPVEGTCATFDDSYLLRSISSPAAHQIATINTYRCVVALTTMRAKNSQSLIFLTKSGGLLEVHQVFGRRWLVVRVVRLQRELVSVQRKKSWPWVTIDGFKFRQNLPILLFMILTSSVHRVCFSDVVGVLCNVFVPSVASCDLIFIGVSQTVAHLNTWSSVEAIFKRVTDDSEVWKSHPTSLDWTRPGHPVTFAFFSHLRLNVLLKSNEENCLI